MLVIICAEPQATGTGIEDWLLLQMIVPGSWEHHQLVGDAGTGGLEPTDTASYGVTEAFGVAWLVVVRRGMYAAAESLLQFPGVRLTVPTPESNDVALSAFKRYVGSIHQSHMVLCSVMTPAAQLVESTMGEPMA